MKKILFVTIAWLSCCLAQAQLSLYYAIPAPTGSWTNYSVPLTESAGWTLGTPAGPAPSMAQFQAVLNSLNGMTISFDTTAQLFFDNVSLADLVTSTFPSCTTDGWMLHDNGTVGCNSAIGNPAGSVNNGAASATYHAPLKYLGNQAAAYGGNLSFDFLGNPGAVLGRVILTESPNPGSVAASGVLPWGDNYSGQSSLPVGLTNLAGIAGGRYHSLALKQDGTVVTSGWNTYSAPDFYLTSTDLSGSVTNALAGLTNVVAVASGAYHNLALIAAGTVVAWGNNTVGQTNVPAGLSNVVAIAGGGYHSLALKRDGTVIAWNSTISRENPIYFGQANVPGNLSNVVAIAAGGFHSLALRADGTIAAWGRTNSGQASVPADLTNAVAIAAGTSHNLALRENGTVSAWGANTLGQTNVPAGLSNVVAVAAGSFFSLALKADGTVVAWGDSTFAQTNVPVGLTNVAAIAGGGYHALALIGNGPPLAQALLLNPVVNSNGFNVSLPSQSGRVYRLEFKQFLTDSNWTALPLAAGNSGTLTLTDSNSTASQRYYRVRRW